MTTYNQLELNVDARLENLSVIADFISGSMSQLGIEEGVFEVQLAVDEACTNAIKYAYSEEGGVITITCDVQGNDFVVTIRDKGKPFDPSSVPPPDLGTDLDKRKIGGLGMYLMGKLMDDVSYSFDAEKGNTLVMRKMLPGKRRER
ncbi:MAG: ATP-binding protein [Dehalococcoidia bacterium]|nr:ATP-binding protein [Dehalococcoidia bacterium]